MPHLILTNPINNNQIKPVHNKTRTQHQDTSPNQMNNMKMIIKRLALYYKTEGNLSPIISTKRTDTYKTQANTYCQPKTANRQRTRRQKAAKSSNKPPHVPK